MILLKIQGWRFRGALVKLQALFLLSGLDLCARSIFSAYSDGCISINYGRFDENSEQKDFIAVLKDALADRVGFLAPDNYEVHFPKSQINNWLEKIEELLAVFKLLSDKFPAPKSV